MFSIEWKRAVRNPATYFALAVGLIISVAQIIWEVVPELEFLRGRAIMEYPDIVFNKGILFGTDKFQSIYYMIMPLLGAIPFAASFYDDMESGYVRQIITRRDKRGYYRAKFLVTFLSAGAVTVIPLIINLMICMALLPSALPQPGVMTTTVFGVELFFAHPYVYTVLYLVMDFILTGVFAIFAVSVSWFSFSRYMSMFMPFIVFYVCHFICQYIGITDWSPYYMFQVGQGIGMRSVSMMVTVAVLFAASVILFVIGGRKNEVL